MRSLSLLITRCLGGLGIGLISLAAGPANALSVTASTNAEAMAQLLLGNGVNGVHLVSGSATYIGSANASGFFYGDKTIFGDPLGVDGVLLTSGSVTNALPPNNLPAASTSNGLAGSAFLDAQIPGYSTYDASILSFKVTVDPGISALEWTYVLGSEEYNEYVNSSFNDVFALSFDGVDLALIPGTSTPVSIDNVNNGNPVGFGTISNPEFYRNNSGPNQGGGGPPSPYDTQYDGLTTVLKSTTPTITSGVEYTLSFEIADAGDYILDSGVFLKAASIGPTDNVPGPLPILGVGAAFGWSRRLRARLRS